VVAIDILFAWVFRSRRIVTIHLSCASRNFLTYLFTYLIYPVVTMYNHFGHSTAATTKYATIPNSQPQPLLLYLAM